MLFRSDLHLGVGKWHETTIGLFFGQDVEIAVSVVGFHADRIIDKRMPDRLAVGVKSLRNRVDAHQRMALGLYYYEGPDDGSKQEPR